MISDELRQESNSALMACQFRMPKFDSEKLPGAVYHYTNTSGLLGIIQSGEMWATDYRFLNDSSEIKYIGLVSEISKKEYLGKHSGLGNEFVEGLATLVHPYPETPYYLCCFSSVDNSLSQWRAYGGEQGFSLKFPGDISTVMLPYEERHQNPGITLLKVIYDQDDQRNYLRNLIDALIKVCELPHMKRFDTQKEAISTIMPFFFGQLDRASYQFKHHDFADEQEWRLVGWGDVHSEFYRDALTLTPYTKIKLQSRSYPIKNGCMPLLSVRYGPSKMATATAYALDRLLNRNGYGASICQRLGSTTPARL